MKKNRIKQNQSKGQVVIIVLLVSAVVMTLGLSLSKKAVVETKIDTDEELLKQAFNAAESGIDYYLVTGKDDYVAPDQKSKAEVSVNQLGSGLTTLDFGDFTLVNQTALFWLVGHDAVGKIDYTSKFTGTTLNFCAGIGFTGSAKVDYFYKEGGSYKVARKGYNFGSAANPNRIENYEQITETNPSCVNGVFTVNASSTPLLLAITPIFSGAKVSVSGDGTFPSQGIEISSTGRAGNIYDSTGVNTLVKVFNRYKVPVFMLEAVTSGNNVLSN